MAELMCAYHMDLRRYDYRQHVQFTSKLKFTVLLKE